MDVDYESSIPRSVSSDTGSSDSSRPLNVDVQIVTSENDRTLISGEESITRIGSEELIEQAPKTKNTRRSKVPISK